MVAEGPALWAALLKVLLLLGGMLLLARYLPFWLNKGRVWPGQQRQLRLVETLPLGADRALYLVEIGKERLLLAAWRHGVTLLGKVPDGVEPAGAGNEGAEEQP